jgi:very-short-patch-repair endonuclease
MDTKTCIACGAAFERPPRVVPSVWVKRKYCSKACGAKHAPRVSKSALPTVKTCETCGSTYERLPSYGNRQWRERKYCSRACMGVALAEAYEAERVDLVCVVCGVVTRVKPADLASRVTCGAEACKATYRKEVTGPKIAAIMRAAYANGHRPKYGGTSPREIALWPLLAGHGWLYGLRFVAPCGSFELDFADIDRKLNVELDGVEHREPRGRRKDAERDGHLRDLGWRIMRVPNNDVDRDVEAVAATVLAWAAEQDR